MKPNPHRSPDLVPGTGTESTVPVLEPIASGAGGLADELNDALSAILGFAELAAANPRVSGDAKLAHYCDEIRKSGLRGSELLRQWVGHGGRLDRVTPGRARRT